MTQRADIMELGSFLLIVDEVRWNNALYLDFLAPLSVRTRCAVLDPTTAEGKDGDPLLAVENELRYALDISTVQDIVMNAKAQRPDIDESGVIAALAYYLDNDAFNQAQAEDAPRR